MGLSYPAYLLSWLFYFICNGVIISAIMLIITKLLVITDDTIFSPGYGFWDLPPIYLLFVLANLGFVLLLSCFFTKAKSGAQAITFIQLISTFLYFLRFSNDLAGNEALTTFLSFFPQMAFNMGVADIAFLMPDFTFSFTYGRANATLALQFVIYTTLALYLEQVLPSESGTHKHPLFFLGIGKKTV
jgi:ATP-binding cassette, subfamily A (ABC1), member 3